MTSQQVTLIAVLIPAYNEARTLRGVIEQTLKHAKHIIVVDDGSTDETVASISNLPITILKNETNQGKDVSLLHGFNHALSMNISGVITLDADGQHDPADIPKFIDAINQYPEHIIIGARLINRENAPNYRRRANETGDFFISWAAGKKIIDTQSGYRFYPKTLLANVSNTYKKNSHFILESRILIDAVRRGFNPIAIPIVSHYPEDRRKSYFRPVADTMNIVKMVGWQLLSRGMCLPGLYRAIFSQGKQV